MSINRDIKDVVILNDLIIRFIALTELSNYRVLNLAFQELNDVIPNEEPHVKAFVLAAMQYLNAELKDETRTKRLQAAREIDLRHSSSKESKPSMSEEVYIPD